MSASADRRPIVLTPQLATPEGLAPYGVLIGTAVRNEGLGIPFYRTVREGQNFVDARFGDGACMRTAEISWRSDFRVRWLERHMRLTQTFVVTGSTPALFVLGKPTHEKEGRQAEIPDLEHVQCFLIPPAHGIMLHLGTWHDFPVSCGPSVSVFLLNSLEVINALASMKEPAPMNHGDCLKHSMAQTFPNEELRFENPFVWACRLGLLFYDMYEAVAYESEDSEEEDHDEMQDGRRSREVKETNVVGALPDDVPLWLPLGKGTQNDTTALLVIDLQHDFLTKGGFGDTLGNDNETLRAVLPKAQQLLQACRQEGMPIIFTVEGHASDLSDCPKSKLSGPRAPKSVHIGDEAEYVDGEVPARHRILVEGSIGLEMVEEVKPLEGELVIRKAGKGAFYGTSLMKTLKARNVTHLLICGATTEVCVYTTLVEANDRGYECCLVHDACASYFPHHHESVKQNVISQGGIFGWTATVDEVTNALENKVTVPMRMSRSSRFSRFSRLSRQSSARTARLSRMSRGIIFGGRMSFLGYSQDELDRAFDQAHWAPNMQEVLARFVHRSIASRSRIGSPEVIPYGGDEHEFFHVWRQPSLGTTDPPMVIFVHGGAWLKQNPEQFAFIAEKILSRGATFVLLEMGGVDDVENSLEKYVHRVRRGLCHAVEPGFIGDVDMTRVFLIGHSSGAHLACTSLLMKLEEAEYNFVGEKIRGVMLMSGIYDLTSVVESNRREYLHDIAEGDPKLLCKLSPFKLVTKRTRDTFFGNPGQPRHSLPMNCLERQSSTVLSRKRGTFLTQIMMIGEEKLSVDILSGVDAFPQCILSIGDNESPEFIRQSTAFHRLCVDQGMDVQLITEPNCNHFEILERFAESISDAESSEGKVCAPSSSKTARAFEQMLSHNDSSEKDQPLGMAGAAWDNYEEKCELQQTV